MPTLATTCPACDSPNITITDRGQLAPFVAARTNVAANLGRTCICQTCTLRFSQARWTETEAQALYADYRGPTYNAERDHHEPGYSQANAHLNQPRSYLTDIETWISTHITPTSVLDIGGNDGGNTPFSRSAPITIMEVGDPEPTQRYDLVVLAHVLEHAATPRDLISTAHKYLNPGGRIYVEVPIEPALDTWHEHIQQFNTQSLHAILGPDANIRSQFTRLGPVLQAIL